MTLALLQQAVMANKTATHRTISIDYCLGQLRIILLLYRWQGSIIPSMQLNPRRSFPINFVIYPFGPVTW
jgi:hypothetical protein